MGTSNTPRFCCFTHFIVEIFSPTLPKTLKIWPPLWWCFKSNSCLKKKELNESSSFLNLTFLFKIIKVDGNWSSWSNWTQCDESSNGNHTRSRSCSNPEPQYGGENCIGVNVETKYCPGIA